MQFDELGIWIFCCCCSVAKLCLTLHNLTDCSMSDFSVSHHLSEFAQIQVCWISDVIQLSHSLSPSSPSAFNLSQHQVFSNESALPIIWPKYWNFSFGVSLSKEYLGLISFKIDWFDLLALQGTLRSLLQHHSWNTPINELKSPIKSLGLPRWYSGKNPLVSARDIRDANLIPG